MKRRILLSLMALFLLVGLVGCSSNDEDAETDKKPSVVENEDKNDEDDLEAKYQHALEVAETDKEEAERLLFELGDYEDSREIIQELKYERAHELFENEEYDAAYKIFVGLGNYKDAEDMVIKVRPFKSN